MITNNNNPLVINPSNDLVIKAVFVPDTTPTDEIVSAVRISTGAQDVSEIASSIGATEIFYATVVKADNTNITQPKNISWSSDNPSVASVDAGQTTIANGIGFATVRFLSNGIANITATVDGIVSNSIRVKIGTPSVQVTPSSTTVEKTKTTQLSAQYRNEAGTVVSKQFVWQSSNPNIATVNSSGLVTGVNEGSVSITATTEGVSSSVNVTVSPIAVTSVEISPEETFVFRGNTTQFTGIARDSNGVIIEGIVFKWEVDDSNLATVEKNLSFGAVTDVISGGAKVVAIREGRVIVSATHLSTGVSATAILDIVRAPYTVQVTPPTSTIQQQNTQQLIAKAIQTSNGAEQPYPIDRWESLQPNIATVSNTGLVTGASPGQATIRATIGGVSATANVTVTQTPFRVDVTPAESNILVGNDITLSAVAKTIGTNQVLNKPVLNWTSENTSVATVNQNGRVVGILPGRVKITATIEDVVGETFVTVNPIPFTVRVTPNSSEIRVNNTVELTAQAISDIDGTVLSNTGLVWQSLNTNIATVNALGVVTGVSVGSTTVTATIGGRVGQSTITVIPAIIPCECILLGDYYGPSLSEACDLSNTIALYRSTCDELIYTNNTCTAPFTGFTNQTDGKYNSWNAGVGTFGLTCAVDAPLPTWRECSTGAINTGTPPSNYVQTPYRGQEGGFCWEPLTTVAFTPPLSRALIYNFQRGAAIYPEPKTITVSNPSYSKSYRITLRTNENIGLTVDTLSAKGVASFILEPRGEKRFIVNVTPEMLELLGDGQSTLELNVFLEEL